MRKSGIVFIIIGLGGLLLLATIANWKSLKHSFKTEVKSKTENLADLQKAQDLLDQGEPIEALKVIHEHEDDIEYRTDTGKKWVQLFIDASTSVRDYPQLVILYESFPKAFEDNEKGSLLVADGYILNKRGSDYEALREVWKGRESRPQDWLVLDADNLLLKGQRREAIELLKTKTFSGQQDTGRLIRLALLNVLENPKLAWDYLTEAYTKDPNNPDIRIYRAKLLESVGKKSLALSEYISAAQTSPNNLFLKDQLAEFYLRNNQFQQAMSIWLDTLKKPSLDTIWVKALFWNKVVTPVQFDWSSAADPTGKLKPFIDYVIHLKPDQFWNEKTFDKIPNGQKYLTNQQASFWLRLLQNLKDGKEKDALELLQFNTFTANSWNPALEIALKRILMYRKAGTLNLDVIPNPLDVTLDQPTPKTPGGTTMKEENQFFNELGELAKVKQDDKSAQKIPNEIHELLLSKEAFAAAFLASGWYEAALQLHSLNVLPASFPDWVAVGMTQALNANRGSEEALKFATMQKPSQGLSLIIGELLAATKNTDSALEHLKKLAKDKNEVGARAAWLISLIYIERSQYQKAKEMINSQPRLVHDTLGKETLARIAMLEGDTLQADKLYGEIVDKSSEAKSYLARKAFQEKDWKKARELTEDLLRQYPDNGLLRENLKKIIEEQQGQAQSQ